MHAVRGGLDIGHARLVQGRGGGDDDRDRNEVGKRHADQGIGVDVLERAVGLAGRAHQGFALLARLHIFRLLRGLPEEQVGRNRGAEDGDQGGEEVGAPSDLGDEQAGERLGPMHVSREQRRDIREQAQGQPFRDHDVTVVIGEHDADDTDGREHRHVEEPGTSDLGVCRHPPWR
jgi:hypothetical protein